MNQKNKGQFEKGSKRASEAGHKGGSKPHPTGARIAKIYHRKGFSISWNGKNRLWEAIGKAGTCVFTRSYREAMQAVDELAEKNDYIETQEK